jgi:hypothetical protein
MRCNMGDKLASLYEQAATKGGGLLGRTRFAMKTSTSFEEAKAMPDSAENLKKFQDIFKELFG